MKIAIVLAVAAHIAGGLSSAIPDAAARCGDLGVMSVPEGVDASQVRQCREHPLGSLNKRDSDSNAPPMNSLDMTRREADAPDLTEGHMQACWHGKATGCTDNYCWKSCGSKGEWCWTAMNGGSGPWFQCTLDSQCYDYMDCGEGENCGSCGCSC